MVATTVAAVRNSILISDTNVLSDDQITQAIADASARIPVTDEIAERYFTCWMLAENFGWSTIRTADGTTFEPPKPDFFKDRYTVRLRELKRGVPSKINWEKVDSQQYGP